ncbi:MAG: chemotaxis protein CheD [Candidatus Zixiibacteriota bacterium]
MLVVGISDMKISTDPLETLVTYSLSSCIGLALYDPVAKVGGLVHCMLPLSKIDPAKAKENPFMFTDTGVTGLLQGLFDKGATRKNIVAKAAGAATLLDEKGMFRIGERNYTVMRKILWKNNILIKSEDVGGNVPRTMYLHITGGKTEIKSQGKVTEL